MARGEDGKLKKAVNFELLRQMLSDVVLEGDEARYWIGSGQGFPCAACPLDGASIHAACKNFSHLFAKFIKSFTRPLCLQVFLEGDEAYEFTWVGKKAAIVEANRPIRKTLRPCPSESVNWDSTENLYIEGDNLEVLSSKVLPARFACKYFCFHIRC